MINMNNFINAGTYVIRSHFILQLVGDILILQINCCI